MKDDLQTFAKSLDPVTSPRLQEAVTHTLELLGGTTDTIDVLVQKLYGGQLDRQIGGSQQRHPRAIQAAVAISAAFLAKEYPARKAGLKSYRDFISDLFPGAGTRWFDVPLRTGCHVLTFNYDRLFEIAFLDRFNIENYGLFDMRVLNSG